MRIRFRAKFEITNYYTLQKEEKEKLLNEEGSQLVSFSPDKQTIVISMEEDIIPIIKRIS